MRTEADAETPPALRAEGLERRHRGGGGIGPIDLRIPRGGFLAILGPSGCGKSTLLRMIAGLEPLDAGALAIDGRSVVRSPPGLRSVALVEQHLPLYDHLVVRENVDMAVSGLELDRTTRASRVSEAIEIAEAGSFVDRKAAMLSGGERARTCLARLLARRPSVALLDEPFAGLDRDLRRRVRTDTLRALATAKVATILVTHDDRDLEAGQQVLEVDSSGRSIG